MPYTVTASFDTAGKTMMGVPPSSLPDRRRRPRPAARRRSGANCGVGASDLLVSVLAMTAGDPSAIVIAKANAGIPQFHGDHIHYSGTPALMADYARLAVDAGARIMGGCCGTSPVHLAAMRAAIDDYRRGERPDTCRVVAEIGPLAAPPREQTDETPRRSRRRG